MKKIITIIVLAIMFTIVHHIRDFADIAVQSPPLAVAITLGLTAALIAIVLIGVPLQLALAIVVVVSGVYMHTVAGNYDGGIAEAAQSGGGYTVDP